MDIDKTSIHFKGTFSNIYEVNKKYPNGGTAGDYVEIDGWAHYWNADRGTWTVNAERDSYWDEKLSALKSLSDNISTSISGEATARKKADDVEAKARENGDKALQERIDTLTTDVTEIQKKNDTQDNNISTATNIATANAALITGIKKDLDNVQTLLERAYKTVAVGDLDTLRDMVRISVEVPHLFRSYSPTSDMPIQMAVQRYK